MTNSLTDIKPTDIIAQIGDFDRTQSTGLNCLIFLAVREQTTVTYQYEELGFEDIPSGVVALCDSLDNDELLDLAGQITFSLIAETATAALDEENAQHLAAQAISDQKQPILSSDY